MAEQADGVNVPDGMSVPEELKRREDRLAAIAEAKGKIEARAAERYVGEVDLVLGTRAGLWRLGGLAAGLLATGRGLGLAGGELRLVVGLLAGVESQIMVVAGGGHFGKLRTGFEQCYNAQAVVDTETMLVMVPQVTQAANDKQQVVPMVEKLQALPEGLNQPEQFLADAGYFSEANVDACEAAGIEPLIALIAVKRDEHHPHYSERFSEPPELPANPTPVRRMTRRLKTGAGRAAYALRKSTVEPVFGIPVLSLSKGSNP